MAGSNRVLCTGSGELPVERRVYRYGTTVAETLAKCGTCGRILKPRPKDGTLRDHSVRGKNTASLDNTLEILWEGAEPDGVAPDGSVTVSPAVSGILTALAAELDKDLDALRQGKGDPLATVEDIAAQLRLLASGSWGAATVPLIRQPT